MIKILRCNIHKILYLITIIIILNFCLINKSFALDTASKTWGDLNISGQLFNFSNLEYLLDDQPRYDNSQSQFQQNNAKAGIGYQYTSHLSFWFGYQYNTDDEISGSPAENRL